MDYEKLDSSSVLLLTSLFQYSSTEAKVPQNTGNMIYICQIMYPKLPYKILVLTYSLNYIFLTLSFRFETKYYKIPFALKMMSSQLLIFMKMLFLKIL